MTRTVFILGAGASHEADLPVGAKLTGIIADRLNFSFDYDVQKSGSKGIFDALRWGNRNKDPRCSDLNAAVKAAHVIRGAMPLAPSIDNFIHTHNDDKQIELCGKLAIAEAILDAEKSSKLFFKSGRHEATMNFMLLKNTWYAEFARVLITNGTIADLQQRLSKISLIVFNYDRCVEHFLYHAFQSYYRLGSKESADLVKSIDIFHPYGSVGNLPWLQSDNLIDFGDVCDGERLFRVAGELRTFTEGADRESTRIGQARARLREADQMVFLGFAFHSLNLDLIFPPDEPFPGRQNRGVFATAWDFSSGDQDSIRELIRMRLNSAGLPIQMSNWKCHDLFRQNQIGLSLL